MHTIPARRRRLAALLLLPFLLVLAGCGRLNADFEIVDASTINLSMDVAFESQALEDGGYTSAEDFCTDASGEESSSLDSAQWEPYEESGLWGCRAEGVATAEDFGADLNLTEEGGELTLSLGSGLGVSQSDLDLYGTYYDTDAFDFRVSFTFPGDVIEASGGEIDGNTVVFSDPVEFNDGVEITAEAGGFPWLIIVIVAVVVGLLLVAVVAVAIFLIVRNRRGGGGSNGTPVPAAYGAAGTPAPGAPQGSGVPPVPGAPPGGGVGHTPSASPQGGSRGQGQAAPPSSPSRGGQPPQGGQASPPAPQGSAPWGGSSAASQGAPQPSQGSRGWGTPAPADGTQQPSPPLAPQPGEQGGPAAPPSVHGPQEPAPQPWDHPDQQRGQQPGGQG